jgi:hypothetical protein
MTRSFVLGNGVSRRGVMLSHLRDYGPVYACNAIYREFTPDVLVATDMPISTVIQESGYSAKYRFHTRKPRPNLGARTVPQKYYGYSSGPIALSLACLDHATLVYLLGFDLGPDNEDKFNNVYAGTEFYKPKGAGPTYTGNWIRQICTIVKDFPKTQFIRIMGKTSAKIKEFDSLDRFRTMDFDLFANAINNQKALE